MQGLLFRPAWTACLCGATPPLEAAIRRYDSNGNVLNDSSHQYTPDTEGRPVTLDTVSLTFDALNRMVEQNNGGSYTEIAYAPTGEKLALMSGQTLQKAFVPLPGGAAAVYTASGLDHYRHTDWLGSVRLASTPSRTVSGDTAYAPFGETYAQSGTPDISFTGQNADTSSSLYDFLFREYSNQGRWPSPDPAGLSATNPSNPQSFNRYAYVFNKPLALVDNLGLASGPICFETEGPYVCFWPSGGGDSGQGGGPPCTVQTVPDSDAEFVVAGYGLPEDFMEMAPPPERCGGGASNTSGFTLGVKQPGQTWKQCMSANANTYSIGGATELTVNVATGTNSSISESTSFITGNGITDTLFGDYSEAAKEGGLAIASAGAGSTVTWGRRTSDIMSLNLAGKGGLPKALGSSGAKGVLKSLGKALNAGLDEAEKFAADLGLAGAEAIGCSIPAGGLVPW